MHREKILVADSSEVSRKKVCDMLNRQGYWTFQATDGAHTLRIARKLKPDLVVIDAGIWGMPAAELGRIIETDGLSTVLYLTSQVTPEFLDMIQKRHVYAYLTKPLQSRQMGQILDFAMVNARKIATLTDKVSRLERSLEGRKIVDRAKGLLMDRKQMAEQEAYAYLRRKAMDNGFTLEQAAETIIQQLQASRCSS